MPPSAPTVTITFTRYGEPDGLVAELLDSVVRQEGVAGEVLFFDQRPSERMRSDVEGRGTDTIAFAYRPTPANSLSHARNLAITEAAHDTILYLDADTVAAPGWAAALAGALAEPAVGVVGGRIVPRWHARPLWITRADFVLDQYSMLDLGPGRREVTKIVGANFGIRRDRLGHEARFDEALGRREGRLFGGEDSDLCLRAGAAGLKVIYDGGAVVEHQVLPERISYAWVLKRMYYAGIGRAIQGGAPQPSRRMGVWDYLALPVVLPAYAAGYLQGRRG